MKTVIIVFLLIPALAVATTLTGTLNSPAGTGMNGTLWLSLSQQGALSASGGCGGPAEIVPTYKVAIKVANGAVSGTVYGNDCMLPNNLYYNVQFTDTSGNLLMSDHWQISGASVDVGTIVSTVVSGTTATLGNAGVVLTAPTGNQTVVQPGGTKLNVNYFNVTGRVDMPNGAYCDTGGCTGFQAFNMMTTDTTQTISGQKTFSSDILGGGSVDVGSSAAPFRNGWFTDLAISSHFKAIFGPSIGSPIDFFDMQTAALGVFRVVDSSSSPIIQFQSTAVLAIPTWTITGRVQSNVNGVYDLGTSSYGFKNLYLSNAGGGASGIHFSHGSTGAGAATLGSNCPALDCSTPYDWVDSYTADGTHIYIPVWH